MSDTQQVLENTSYYLENYLNPAGKWSKHTLPKQRFAKIRYADVDWQAVTSHIKSMDYQEFLKTPYWKAIASYSKYKARYRCQLCNSTHRLATHHRSYEIHGKEHEHINDLIVICDECHTVFHQRIAKPKALKASDDDSEAGAVGVFILGLIFLGVLCILFTK